MVVVFVVGIFLLVHVLVVVVVVVILVVVIDVVLLLFGALWFLGFAAPGRACAIWPWLWGRHTTQLPSNANRTTATIKDRRDGTAP